MSGMTSAVSSRETNSAHFHGRRRGSSSPQTWSDCQAALRSVHSLSRRTKHVLRWVLEREQRLELGENDAEFVLVQIPRDFKHVRQEEWEKVRILHLLKEREKDFALFEPFREVGEHADQAAEERCLLLPRLGGEGRWVEEVERRDREAREERVRAERLERDAGVGRACK